jgi:hypothetical protein
LFNDNADLLNKAIKYPLIEKKLAQKTRVKFFEGNVNTTREHRASEYDSLR